MDSVKRRLEHHDMELTSRHWADHCSESVPLLMPVICFGLGILIESWIQGPRGLWLGLLLCAPVILFWRSPQRYLYLACAMALPLGSLRLACYGSLPASDISHQVTDVETPATLTGIITSTPQSAKTDWVYGSQQPDEPGQSFDLRLDGAYTGLVRVYVKEQMPVLTAGNRVRLHARIGKFKPAANPGQFDMAEAQARRNCLVSAFVKSPAGIDILPDDPSLWLPILRLRSQCQKKMAETLVLTGDNNRAGTGVLQALLLGMRSNIPSVTLHDFQTTGLLHLISLSGLHVGVLMSLVWFMCKCAGLLKPARATLCLCVLAGFLWLVPLRAATVRASVIAGLFCVAILLRRKPHPVNTLSLAALVLLLYRPTQLFEAGWQLSFSSVLGILLLTPRLESWRGEHLLGHLPAVESRLGRVLTCLMKWGLALLIVGLSAWLGSAALLAYHFYSVTPLSVLYTLLALPWVGLIVMVGSAHILFAVICTPLLPVTLAILGLLSQGLVHTVQALAQIPHSRILLGHLSFVPVTLYYGLGLSGLVVRKPWTKRSLILLALTVPLVWIQWPRLLRARRPILELTCLSVGHGQALLLHHPRGPTYLFDAGSLYQKDIGRRVVTACLDHRGLSSLDAIWASHNDADHINGIPEILQHCSVAKIYAPAMMIDQAQRDQGPAPWLEAYLRSQERTLEPVPRILHSDASPETLRIETLWPHTGEPTKGLSDNNGSLVLLIRYGRHSILITSDIEQATQQRLAALYPDLRADIVVAPHHGSTATLSDGFLDHLEPEIILCSGSATALRRGRVVDTPITYHTARHGAITLTVPWQGPLSVETWLTH